MYRFHFNCCSRTFFRVAARRARHTQRRRATPFTYKFCGEVSRRICALCAPGVRETSLYLSRALSLRRRSSLALLILYHSITNVFIEQDTPCSTRPSLVARLASPAPLQSTLLVRTPAADRCIASLLSVARRADIPLPALTLMTVIYIKQDITIIILPLYQIVTVLKLPNSCYFH